MKTCRRGHPLTEDNIYVRPSTGRKECRECKRMHKRLALPTPLGPEFRWSPEVQKQIDYRRNYGRVSRQ